MVIHGIYRAGDPLTEDPENLLSSSVGKPQPPTCKVFNAGEHRLRENKRE